ncbi:ABC transporter [Klebsiella pneumoniae]|nr:ABC transporter [Klebsiella pneumoniae]
MPENPASYRVVRTKSYLFNKAPAEQKEMDHVEPDEQTSSRFFHYQGSVYDIADFMCDDRFPEWHAGYPLNAFAMLMIRVTDSGDTIDIGLLH